ncbi:MAG: hypothetical protein J0H30_11765 [Alphaproteobacteria bacterium]|nr:hypothetical protein [Alphaproteobacteria bacterium]MBN9571690.1 hypothetical protein [Alphaproteobacteria bacterium]OJU58197.1 MAG: hypothetical protein BGO00_13510 [Alphaproteobacteria bacterium 62-8]
MIRKTIGGVVLAMLAGSLLLVGVGFAGFAIYAALLPALGMAGAAALTAFILLIGPVVFALTAFLQRRREPLIKPGEMAMFAALSAIVRERPVLTLLGAGLLGAAEIFLKKRR